MPRRSGMLRSSVLLDTGSSGTCEVECLKILCPQRESAVMDAQLCLMVRRPLSSRERKSTACHLFLFVCFHPKACY